MRTLAVVVGLFAPAVAAAAPATFEQFQEESSLVCVGDPDVALPKPETHRKGGFTFELGGALAKVRRDAASSHPGEARLGVLSGIKDLEPITKAALEGFLGAFREADVDAILVGGDSAYGELELEDVLAFLGASDRPVLAVIGNNEGRSSFNRAVRTAWKKHPNVLNLDLVRRVDGAGFDVISLPGYFDKAYASASSSCLYRPADVAALPALASRADDPVVLLTHGPPQQDGKAAIDFVPGAGNVGDPELAKAIAEAKIPFGVHGHILEAGGRATDLSGKKPVAEGKPAKELFLAPGQANGLPYTLSLGWTSHGTAAILTVRANGQGSWRLLKAPKPKAP